MGPNLLLLYRKMRLVSHLNVLKKTPTTFISQRCRVSRGILKIKKNLLQNNCLESMELCLLGTVNEFHVYSQSS